MRERDYSFEALTEVCGINLAEITSDERGRVNAALKQLREVHPDDFLLADMIHDRAKLYTQVYEGMALTPQALAGNWSQLPAKAEEARKSRVVVTNVYAPAGDCELCEGNKLVLVSVRPAPNPVDGHEDAGSEEYAPCPACSPTTDTSFYRVDGSRFRSPDPARVRELMNG